MLRLHESVYDAIVAHARRAYPEEACGMLSGPAGTGRPDRHIEMVNVAASNVYYEFDPVAALHVLRDIDERGEELVAVYHSHTDAEAYPSRTDVELAYERVHYIVMSVSGADGPVEFRSFRIDHAGVLEDDVIAEP